MESKDFQEFFKNAIDDIQATFKDKVKFTPDHISLLTECSEDYEKAKEEYKDMIVDTKEIPNCGRRITIANLKNPIIVDGFTLPKLEISEPKPMKLTSERRIDHVSFIPNNFSEFIKFSKENKVDLYDAMEIGSVILCKWKAPNSHIEFRSSPEFVLTSNLQAGDSELEKYKNEALENKQKALRALADYQNLRKRMETDKETFQFVANTALIGKLLDISDDFGRADEFVEKEEDHNKVKSAYKSVKDKLFGVISDFGLEEIPVQVGDAFDMHTMEAIGTLVTELEEENDTVKHVASKGYKYSNKDNIVRPAKVIVAKYSVAKKEGE
ncbi:MAG: nucleotide exchange factor GrpE [bacterium]